MSITRAFDGQYGSELADSAMEIDSTPYETTVVSGQPKPPAALTTKDVGQAIIRTLDFPGLEHIDDSDENNLRAVTEAGVFAIHIVRED